MIRNSKKDFFRSCASLATAAIEFQMVCPEVIASDTETRLAIVGGRHVLQELCVPTFIPNDSHFDDDCCVHVISGPNASGKSVYLKQVRVK